MVRISTPRVRIGSSPITLLCFVAIAAAALLLMWVLAPDALVGLFIFFAVMLLIEVYSGVTLTPAEARVRSLLPRRIPWTSVASVLRERDGFAQNTIVLVEHSGRRTRLRAPRNGFLAWDPGFDEKYRTIGEWYLAHR